MATKDIDIFSGPLKHKDIIIDRIKRIFKKNKKKAEGPTHEGELDAVKDLKKTAESGTNSYAKDNQKTIKKLKA